VTGGRSIDLDGALEIITNIRAKGSRPQPYPTAVLVNFSIHPNQVILIEEVFDEEFKFNIPHRNARTQVKDMKIAEEREFDYARSINRCTWHFIKDGREKTHNLDLRVYTYYELIAMFKKAGFVDIEGFGTIKDEPISRDHQMMFIFGTRPK